MSGAVGSLDERLLSWAGARALAGLARSWRSETVGLEEVAALLAEGKKVMVAFWHGGYLPLFPLLEGRGACIVASRSRRGRILCGIARRFGQECTTIPESGPLALAGMREALAGRRLAALAADGPLGPYRVVKRGACRLAADLQLNLVPAAFAARPCLVLRGRWDHMAVPLPFARLCLVLGPPLQIPADLAGDPLGTWAGRLHDALVAAGEQAGKRLGW